MVAARTSGGPGGRGGFAFTWRGAAVAQALDNAMQDAMQATALEAKAEAQALAPVDTGLLKSSVFADVNASGGAGRRTLVVGANAPYAVYVELGTSRMAAQPFLRPTLDKIAPKLTANLRAAIKGIR